MKVTDDLYIVGGGDAGFNLSGSMDANCYLFDTGDGLWLFDVGFDSCGQICANIEAHGLDVAQIEMIFITHHHADHSGALAEFADRCPSADIAVAAEVADGVRTGNESVNGLDWAKDVGYYPASFTLRPARVDSELASGMEFTKGNLRVKAIATPGHCFGHFSYLIRGPQRSYLVGGDQVFCDGKILLQNLPDVSISETASSMETLLTHEFDGLLPGHGRFSLDNGRRHLELAKATFDAIGVPPNMF